MHNGVRYFTCSERDAGSFLRPKKIRLGTTFIEAVREVCSVCWVHVECVLKCFCFGAAIWRRRRKEG